jgi:hypothetical protein
MLALLYTCLGYKCIRHGHFMVFSSGASSAARYLWFVHMAVVIRMLICLPDARATSSAAHPGASRNAIQEPQPVSD